MNAFIAAASAKTANLFRYRTTPRERLPGDKKQRSRVKSADVIASISEKRRCGRYA